MMCRFCEFIAALPMYDWAETRAETDAEWARLRDHLRANGVDAPGQLARRNADLPPVPGGIRAANGRIIAPDPATLPPDEFDFHAVWYHPRLLLAQTCWGPMELGVSEHVQVVGQPDYSIYDGGQGSFYSSAVVMRRSGRGSIGAPAEGAAIIPLERLRGARLAFNSTESMSGIIALGRDLEALGASLDVFSERIETGAHRSSARAVAEGWADVAAIDCRTWHLIRRFEPDVAEKLAVVGWTGKRMGLPLIASRSLAEPVVRLLRSALAHISEPASQYPTARSGTRNPASAGALPS